MKSVVASVLLLTSVVAALPSIHGMYLIYAFISSLTLTLSSARPYRRTNQIIPVVVGGPQDTFVPNSIVAAVGDIVQFQFSNGNHTVTQSTADTACKPKEGGIHSGHIPFQDGQADVGTFNVPVTSTEPMFLYCATGPHCQEGQVMIVNAQSAQQVAEYSKLSQASKESVDGTNVVGGTAGKISLATAA
jgi:plastocyanin